MVTVPELAGWNKDTAREKLRALNLTLLIKPEETTDVPVDCVVRTDPAAGSVVKAGTTVTLYIRRDRSVLCYCPCLHRFYVGTAGEPPPDTARPGNAGHYGRGCVSGRHGDRSISERGCYGDARYGGNGHRFIRSAARGGTASGTS